MGSNMRFHKIGLTVCAAAAFLAANPATAASSAFATMSVSYSLVDLDPLDSIAASISFGPLTSDSNYSWVYKDSPDDYRMLQSASDVSVALDSTPIKAASSVSSSAGLTFNLSASGSAANLTSDSEGNIIGSNHNSFDSIAAASRQFTLSANTMVIFRGVSTIGANITHGEPEIATGYATLNVDGNSEDWVQGQSYYDANYLTYKNYLEPNQLKDKTLGVSFTNLTTMNATGNLYGQVEAQGFTSTLIPAAVPEPESYAMLLAGLGLMGAIVRRRKRQDRQSA